MIGAASALIRVVDRFVRDRATAATTATAAALAVAATKIVAGDLRGRELHEGSRKLADGFKQGIPAQIEEGHLDVVGVAEGFQWQGAILESRNELVVGHAGCPSRTPRLPIPAAAASINRWLARESRSSP